MTPDQLRNAAEFANRQHRQHKDSVWGSVAFAVGYVALGEYARRTGDPRAKRAVRVLDITTAVVFVLFLGLFLIGHFSAPDGPQPWCDRLGDWATVEKCAEANAR